MFCFFLPSLEDEHMAVLTLGESHKDLNDNTNNKARGCFWFWTVKKALINSHYTNCHGLSRASNRFLQMDTALSILNGAYEDVGSTMSMSITNAQINQKTFMLH